MNGLCQRKDFPIQPDSLFFPIFPPHHYQSYLLGGVETRSEDRGQPAIWHFSLQDAKTSEKRHFPDLAALLAFLQDEFKNSEPSPTTE